MTLRSKLLMAAASRRIVLAQDYPSTILADSPVNYWRFSETSGTDIADLGSAPQTAVLVAPFTRNIQSLVPGESDPSVFLETSYAGAGTAGRFSGQQEFSFECWFRVDSFTSSANPVLFFTGRFASAGWYVQVINTVAARPYIQFSTSHPSTVNTESATSSICEGSVYHLVGVRSGTTVKIYLNAVEPGYRVQGNHGANITATTDPTQIAGYWNSGPIVNKLNGRIDDIAIYDYALSPQQVADHYAAGIGGLDYDPHENNVISLIHLDSGSFLTDQKGHTWTNNTAVSEATDFPKFGSAAAYFDGTGDDLRLSSGFGLWDFGSNDLTIEGWIRPEAWGVPTGGRGIISRRTSGTNGWAIGIDELGKLRWRALIGGVWSDTRITSTDSVSLNTYGHFALTRDQNTWRLFYNGVLQGSQVASGVLGHTATDTVLGAATSSTAEWPFLGHIDEVRETRNVCRYKANFTPPATQFPNPI